MNRSPRSLVVASIFLMAPLLAQRPQAGSDNKPAPQQQASPPHQAPAPAPAPAPHVSPAPAQHASPAPVQNPAPAPVQHAPPSPGQASPPAFQPHAQPAPRIDTRPVEQPSAPTPGRSWSEAPRTRSQPIAPGDNSRPSNPQVPPVSRTPNPGSYARPAEPVAPGGDRSGTRYQPNTVQPIEPGGGGNRYTQKPRGGSVAVGDGNGKNEIDLPPAIGGPVRPVGGLPVGGLPVGGKPVGGQPKSGQPSPRDIYDRGQPDAGNRKVDLRPIPTGGNDRYQPKLEPRSDSKGALPREVGVAKPNPRSSMPPIVDRYAPPGSNRLSGSHPVMPGAGARVVTGGGLRAPGSRTSGPNQVTNPRLSRRFGAGLVGRERCAFLLKRPRNPGG